MSQMVTRWSIPYREGAAIGEDGKIIEHFVGSSQVVYTVKLRNIADLLGELRTATQIMRKSDYNSNVCKNASLAFIKEDWDDLYGDGEGNLYVGEGRYNTLYNNLLGLTRLGYDVRPQWQKFKDILKEIWVLLPDFYKGYNLSMEVFASEKGFAYQPANLPVDYDPNKPFPNLEIPQDID